MDGDLMPLPFDPRPSPQEIAAAWAAWKVRHKDKIGPGPGFSEAIAAAFAERAKRLKEQTR